jgi:hypothetical protein
MTWPQLSMAARKKRWEAGGKGLGSQAAAMEQARHKPVTLLPRFQHEANQACVNDSAIRAWTIIKQGYSSQTGVTLIQYASMESCQQVLASLL